MCAKILRVCKALHARGVRISFDPNVRKESIGDPAYFEAVREMIAMSAIFLPSEDDAARLPGEDIAAFAAELFASDEGWTDGGNSHFSTIEAFLEARG